MARRIEVEIIGDARSFQRAMGQASGAGSRLGNVLRGAGKAALVGAATAAGVAITGLGAAAVVGFKEFREGARVTEQVRARLKSTGQAANVTMRDINGLANATLAKTGIDDEAVKAADAMLLSFTRVRNEVGEGNDIFNQATAAIADIATAMNDGAIPTSEQMTQETIRLGKALNDPIRGITALTRVGVTFSDSQRDQIETLVESGKTMEAQKIILAELNKEFGGSAEAAGKADGGIRILVETFKNLAAEGVAPLIPQLRRLTAWVQDHLPEIRQVFRAVFRAVGSIVGAAAETVSNHADTIKQAFAAVRQFITDSVLPVFRRLREFASQQVRALGAFIQQHRAELTSVFESMRTVIFNVMTIIRRMAPVVKNAIADALPFLRTLASTLATISSWAASAAGAVQRLDSAVRSLSGSGGGGLLDIIPGGNTSLLDILKADGGPVSGRRPYIVGERGPELFVPRSSGTIVPNHALGGGGGGSVNVIVLGGDREAINYLRRLDVREARRSGRGLL